MRAPRLWVAVAIVASACGAGSEPVAGLADLVADASPGDRIEVPAGTHAGPIVIDKAIALVGLGGVVIVAPHDTPAITIVGTSDVLVSDLTVEGGESGVWVDGSVGVTLDRVTVRGAEWHGIYAQDAQITVRDCVIGDLRAPHPQGVEIINSDSRPASLVEGCRIEGPVVEGVVSHVAHVTFRDNEVVGSTLRGIAVTEMSDGRIEGNRVLDATGSAYFCGDMSRCSVVDNVAQGVASENAGFRSSDGHGLVVHFHSQAFVDKLMVGGLEGEGLVVMIDSGLSPTSLYP